MATEKLPSTSSHTTIMATEKLPSASSHTTAGTIDARDSREQQQDESTRTHNDIQNDETQLHGLRLYLVLAGVGMGIFLVQLEITIVSTSLVSIVNEISGLQDVSWVVTAYLITYSGSLTILSKLSDIFGRRSLMTFSFIAYIAFSLGCGFSQSLLTLIVLRAFQGIGAGGIFALSYVILPEVIAPHLYSAYASYIAAIAAVASLLGPLLGGAICNNSSSSWRWIFWLNGPIGVFAACLILLGLPRYFPFHNKRVQSEGNQSLMESIRDKFQRIDFLGAILLLGACVLLITGLEEGAIAYPWNSALPLSTVIISVFLWISFILWSRHLSLLKETKIEAIFPWSLMLNRFAMGALISTFFSGSAIVALAISLPQRLQLIQDCSPFLSGVYILPLTISVSLGAALTGLLLAKFRIPPLYILVTSAILEIIGVALLGGQTVRYNIPAALYGLQVLIGFGIGLNTTTAILLIAMVVNKKQQATGMGSVGQFRNLGGSIVLSIFANVLNPDVTNKLTGVLNPEQLDAVTQYPENILLLPTRLQNLVKDAYEDGYQLQLRVLLAFTCGALLASALVFERRPRHQNEKGELVE